MFGLSLEAYLWCRVVWWGGHLPAPPKGTVWSLTMMMKHGHIGKTEIVGDQQADSAQGSMHCPYHYWYLIKSKTNCYWELMVLPRVLASADVVLILPRGSYYLFLLRRGWWHPLWVVSCQILFCQFFYGGVLVASHLPPFSGSWESCCHLGVLEGHSPNWDSHCVSRGNPSGFQIQSPHRISYNQHAPFFFFSLVGQGEEAG